MRGDLRGSGGLAQTSRSRVSDRGRRASRPRSRMTVRASASLVQRIGAPMAVGEFLPLAIHLTAEVAELHRRGAVHGDLNPARIAVDQAAGALSLAGSAAAGR